MILEDCDMFVGLTREKTIAAESRASIIVQAVKHYPGVVILTMKDPRQFHVLHVGFYD